MWLAFECKTKLEILGHWFAREAEAVPLHTIYAIEPSAYRNEFRHSKAAGTGPLTHHLITGCTLCVEYWQVSLPW